MEDKPVLVLVREWVCMLTLSLAKQRDKKEKGKGALKLTKWGMRVEPR
jgi:hypothetical protein